MGGSPSEVVDASNPALSALGPSVFQSLTGQPLGQQGGAPSVTGIAGDAKGGGGQTSGRLVDSGKPPPSGPLPGGIGGPGLISGGPEFQGDLVAPLTGTETGLIDTITGREPFQTGDLNRFVNPALSTATDDLLQSTIEGKFLDPTANSGFASALENVLAPVRTAAGAAGQFASPGGSSPFTAATLQAGNTFGFNVTQAERQTQQRAAEVASGREAGQQGLALGSETLGFAVSQAELGNLFQQLSISALPRLIEQHGIDRALQLFRERVNTSLQATLGAGALAQSQPILLPGSPGPLPSLIGAGGTIGGAAAGNPK